MEDHLAAEWVVRLFMQFQQAAFQLQLGYAIAVRAAGMKQTGETDEWEMDKGKL